MSRRMMEFVGLAIFAFSIGAGALNAQSASAPKPASKGTATQQPQPLWPAPPPSSASPSPAKASAPPSPAIPAGTVVRIELGTTLTDATNKAGDKFTGTVDQSVIVKGKVVVPKYSEVYGHVAYVKPAGRIHGKGEMRIVLDQIVTPANLVYPLTASVGQGEGPGCGPVKKGRKPKGTTDSEGVIHGCGKSKKGAAKAAAIVGGMGALGGLSLGLATRGGCDMYGYCWPSSGPGVGTDMGIGAGIGAGTALVYELFKHEKHIVLVEGTDLSFTINRAIAAPKPAATTASTE